MEHLEAAEAKRLRIFTFGGWSFISLEKKCHPDSHNYISAKDLIPVLGSPNLRDLALELYHGDKKGISHEKVINKLVVRDTQLFCNFLENYPETKELEDYMIGRSDYYKCELKKLNNVTVLDPKGWIEHEFKNKCYQDVVWNIVKKYR